MNHILLDTPSADGHSVPVAHKEPGLLSTEQRDQQDVCIGPYSVSDSKFIRRAVSDLMQCCVLHECDIPECVVAALNLEEGNRHAIGMANALLQHMPDLHERRDAICLMIHEIVSFQ